MEIPAMANNVGKRATAHCVCLRKSPLRSDIGDRTLLLQHSIPVLIENAEAGKSLLVSLKMAS
jgi:hypothetical protein